MSNLLSALLFLGVAIGMLTYWIIMMFKGNFPLPHYVALLISGTVTAIVLMILDISFSDAQKVVEVVNFLSTPAIICLAIPLYQQIQLLKKNARLITSGIIAGIVGSVFGVLLLFISFMVTQGNYMDFLPEVIAATIYRGLSGKTGVLTVMIALAVMVSNLLGYKTICLVIKMLCKRSGFSEKQDRYGLEKLSVVVTSVVIAMTCSCLMEWSFR